ncbi:hypothetical protein [Sedimentimonas flavescens]|uniref:hypothetical protein n=1 Tax=Sedimentimonas flavescens TaxID=2851012 RepID=UPI001C4A2248|nr:hypothetical protein [Sedimentimonas flavescens]MBW0159653.1 hypothetical protein [Sedimentimonas flavescens]
MLEIPELRSLRAFDPRDEAVRVTVKIDNDRHLMPEVGMASAVLTALVQAFLSGDLKFMSFDEHPKRLTGINLTTRDKSPSATLIARSLVAEDAFPENWRIADPESFGA